MIQDILSRWKSYKDSNFEDIFYSNKLSILYFAVPKAGNTTIKELLLRNHDPEMYNAFLKSNLNVHQYIRMHSDLSIRKNEARKVASNCRAFTVLRAPETRIVSFYLDKIIGDGWERRKRESFLRYYNIDRLESPDEVIKKVLKVKDQRQEIHLRSQYEIISDQFGIIPKEIYNLDNLHKLSLAFCDELQNLDALEPSARRNRTSSKPPDLSNETLGAIRSYYKKDYELLRTAR